jgi:WD40 repeat protein
MLAIPHTEKGHVKVRQFSDKRQEAVIMCHQGSIAAMALNRTGDLLATASEKGTLIRIWKVDSANPTLPVMFRRGADKAEINDLQFSRNSKYIAATSDHNTIHVFGIELAFA